MPVGKCSGSVTSLPPPRPKSPPEYPDLYGKRRELAKVQMMEREIGFLEEELKSVEGLQPASRSCKEFCDGKCRSSNPHKKEDSEISTLLEMDLVLSSEPCTCDVEYHVSTSRGYVAAVAAHLKVAPTAMHVVAVTHVRSAICLNAIVRPAGIANVLESRNVAWIVAVVSPNVLHSQPVVP